jgi:hypothetical protein
MRPQFSISNLLILMTIGSVGFALVTSQPFVIVILGMSLIFGSVVGSIIGMIHGRVGSSIASGILGTFACLLLFLLWEGRIDLLSVQRGGEYVGTAVAAALLAIPIASVAAVFDRPSGELLLWPTLNCALVAAVPGSLTVVGVTIGAAIARYQGTPWDSPVGSGEIYSLFLCSICTLGAATCGACAGLAGIGLRAAVGFIARRFWGRGGEAQSKTQSAV